MPRKQTPKTPAKKSKKKPEKVFEKDTNIETGFSTLQETDHRLPIRGDSAAPEDIWENEVEGLGGKAKSDLPYGLPTDDVHFDSKKIRGVPEPYAPDKKTVEAARRELNRTDKKKSA
ncbi:MAG: hypothetical protein JWO13_307 [Acidobacteriales bacterium]|nr:hypothetical protein [Terriglobales bacterium]